MHQTIISLFCDSINSIVFSKISGVYAEDLQPRSLATSLPSKLGKGPAKTFMRIWCKLDNNPPPSRNWLMTLMHTNIILRYFRFSLTHICNQRVGKKLYKSSRNICQLCWEMHRNQEIYLVISQLCWEMHRNQEIYLVHWFYQRKTWLIFLYNWYPCS